MLIITGTSKGIGKAIAKNYLQRGEKVIGIGREHTINDSNYQSVLCDLADTDSVRNSLFTIPENEPITFIHNAGVLGTVDRFSASAEQNLRAVFEVNVFAGCELLQRVLKEVKLDQHLTIVMISSGAAKRAIPSWSAYCASKAAVEMLTETVYLEELERGRSNFTCYAVAPGVVDTNMQSEIREVDPRNFSSHANFVAYHANNELVAPSVVALKLEKLLSMPFLGEVSVSLRNIE